MTKKQSSLKKVRVGSARVAIVWSRFNQDICQALLEGALKGLKENGIAQSSIEVVEVPGAFEIPLASLKLAQTKKYAGVICLGAVVRGETSHYDYVCLGVTEGILQAQLETGVPMAFGILTTDTVNQALARAGAGKENKGYEAAQVVLEMISICRKIFPSPFPSPLRGEGGGEG